jgi:hypothetical protein
VVFTSQVYDLRNYPRPLTGTHHVCPQALQRMFGGSLPAGAASTLSCSPASRGGAEGIRSMYADAQLGHLSFGSPAMLALSC